jgi:hypothetical protein
MASVSAVVYFLFVVSMGGLPSFTGVSLYQDKDSCTAAVATMTKAMSADDTSVKLVCVASSDVQAMVKAAGL